jgi:hypothetical protein
MILLYVASKSAAKAGKIFFRLFKFFIVKKLVLVSFSKLAFQNQ